MRVTSHLPVLQRAHVVLRTTWPAYCCGREFPKGVTKDESVSFHLRYHFSFLPHLQSTLVLLALKNLEHTRLRSSGIGRVTDEL